MFSFPLMPYLPWWQVLQWPQYEHIRDQPEVLLVGEADSYALVARMLETVSQCFRSRRVHIGTLPSVGSLHGLACVACFVGESRPRLCPCD
jgi:hypothetical protein